MTWGNYIRVSACEVEAPHVTDVQDSPYRSASTKSVTAVAFAASTAVAGTMALGGYAAGGTGLVASITTAVIIRGVFEPSGWKSQPTGSNPPGPDQEGMTSRTSRSEEHTSELQ